MQLPPLTTQVPPLGGAPRATWAKASEGQPRRQVECSGAEWHAEKDRYRPGWREHLRWARSNVRAAAGSEHRAGCTGGRGTFRYRTLPTLSIGKASSSRHTFVAIPQGGSTVKPVPTLPGANHGLLRGVIRVYHRSKHPVAMARQRGSMYFNLGDIRDHLRLKYHSGKREPQLGEKSAGH